MSFPSKASLIQATPSVKELADRQFGHPAVVDAEDGCWNESPTPAVDALLRPQLDAMKATRAATMNGTFPKSGG
jgi:hypothetical protein